MATALFWWLALQALSLASLPVCLVLFRSLPDRGYAFTKTLGPLILAVLLWWLGSLSLLPNQRGTVLLLAYLLILGGLVAIRPLRRSWDAAPASRWPAIVLTEVVFASVFLFWALIRAYNPEIEATEKPMDFAFLNASYRARSFPPEDPWLSGFPIAYYYLGYLNAASLTKLVGVPTAVGFNLALATVAAQAAAAACGFVYNLAQTVRRQSPGAARASAGPLVAGAAAVLLLLGIGNLEGLLELARAHGWAGDALWNWVDVKDLRATPLSDRWYPTDLWFWWRATRVIQTTVNGQALDYTITEFPFFSFLLGDLHPHVMALPLVLLTLGMAFQVLLDPDPPQLAWRRPFSVLGPGALLGALGFTNVWDLPALGTVLLITGGLRWTLEPDRPAQDRFFQWVTWAAAVVVGALLFFAPFYVSLIGAGRSVLGGTAEAASRSLPLGVWTGPGSRPFHLLLFWAPFFLASGLFLWGVAGSLPKTLRRAAYVALLAPVGLWAGLELTLYPLNLQAVGAIHASPLPIAAVWPKLWAAGPLLVALVLLGRGARPCAPTGDPLPETANAATPPSLAGAVLSSSKGKGARGLGLPSRAVLFGTGLVAAALLLLFLCEVVFLRDVFGNRMNTVFKLTYQAWAFLAVASAFGLYYCYVTGRWRGPVLGTVAALLCGAFVYVPMAVFNRTEGFNRPPTLDGLAFVERMSPSQRAAVDWLWAHTARQRAVILEASGPQYSGFAQMSSRTGLPTLLGWPGHESQWRGSLPVFGERQHVIDQVFRAPDKRAVLPLLDQHQVTYVIVGPAERGAYPAEGLDAFAATLEVAFRQGDVTIYRVRSPFTTESTEGTKR